MWLRNSTIDILKYLPEFLQSDNNFKSVADVCSSEHELIRAASKDIFDQFFINSATWGLAGYERILNITPKTSDDYAVRRQRILTRYQANKSSTIKFLESLAKKYMTADSVATIAEDNSNYSFKLITTGGSVLYLAELFDAINLYKPAHLNWLLHYERPVNMVVSAGQFIRISKFIIVRPAANFNLNTVNGSTNYGCYIRIAKKSIVKVVE